MLKPLNYGLAIAVLSAFETYLELQLCILPGNLHHLAVASAFPSIRNLQSLTLDINSLLRRTDTAEAVMKAVATVASGLQWLRLMHIPVRNIVRNNFRLLHLISNACKSASDVSLSFGCLKTLRIPDSQPVAQLTEAPCQNSSPSSLHLIICDEPQLNSRLDCILGARHRLQSLSLKVQCDGDVKMLPAPSSIIGSRCLTHLCLGRGFHLMDLPQMVPHMTNLQSLYLKEWHLPELSPLTFCSTLQTLELRLFYELVTLPTIASLPALQSLKISNLP
jgi:hypothetical protein